MAVNYDPNYTPNSNDTIVGGPGATNGIGAGEENGADRIGGSDRYETNDMMKDRYDDLMGKTHTVEREVTRTRRVKCERPKPQFHSDVKKITKYEYFFGIDSFKAFRKSMNTDCGFLTRDVYVGSLIKDNGEYIQIDTDYSISSDSNIEFYVIDGQRQIPIMPVKDTIIVNEKLFAGLNTRFVFNKDDRTSYKIFKDGSEVDIDYLTAISDKENNYYITYKPLFNENNYKYTPINDKIKIKMVLRLYNINGKVPFVDKITIRKVCENNLWLDI